MMKKPQSIEEALPAPMPEKKSSLAEAVTVAGNNGLGAAALIDAFGAAFGASDAQSALWRRSSRVRGLPGRPHGAGQELALCELLISKGADPLAASNSEDPYSMEGSLVGALAAAGLWKYAQAVVERAGPDGRARALLVLEQESQKKSFAPPSIHSMLANAGPGGIAFGAWLGMDASALVSGQPWAALSRTADDLEAFAKAGARMGDVDSRGQSLSEIFAQRAPGRDRQALMAAISRLAPAASKEVSVKMMEDMARWGSFKEFSTLARKAGLHPSKAAANNGRSMLGIALESGNWAVARDLMRAGADPMEPCGEQGLPAGARALIAESRWDNVKAAAGAQEAAVAELLAKMDFSWRSPEGLPILEAAAAAANQRAAKKVDWRGERGGAIEWREKPAIAWARAEPDSQGKPMWERALELGMPDQVAAAIAGWKMGEASWGASGLGVLEWAASVASESMSDESCPVWTLLSARLEAAEEARKPPTGGDRNFDVASPEQWSGAVRVLWEQAHLAQKESLASRGRWNAKRGPEMIIAGMKNWASRLKMRGIDAFEFDDLRNWAFAGWSDENPASGHWAGKMVLASVYLDAPELWVGDAVLDLAAKGTSVAINAACEAWDASRRRARGILPQSHSIYEWDWTPGGKVASSPLGPANSRLGMSIQERVDAAEARLDPPEPPRASSKARRL